MEEYEHLKSDPRAHQWIEGIRSDRTRRNYLYALKKYVEWSGLSPEVLIQEALGDKKREEPKNTVRNRLLEFYKWLTTKAEVKRIVKEKGGKTRSEVIKKGHTSEMSRVALMGVRSFYSEFGVLVKLTGRSRIKKSKIVFKRKELTREEVKTLLEYCTNLRDKAIVSLAFQSSLDVSTICSLKASDVNLDRISPIDHKPRLELMLRREKSDVDFVTYARYDTIDRIRMYVNDLKRKGVQLEPSDNMFLKDTLKSKKGITPNLIEILLKQLALKAGMIKGSERVNPVSPHSLRESFSKILIAAGMPRVATDEMQGHSEGALDSAYFSLGREKIEELYARYENQLALDGNGNGLSFKVEALKTEFMSKLEELTKNNTESIETLRKENDSLRNTLKGITDSIDDVGRTLEVLQKKIGVRREK